MYLPGVCFRLVEDGNDISSFSDNGLADLSNRAAEQEHLDIVQSSSGAAGGYGVGVGETAMLDQIAGYLGAIIGVYSSESSGLSTQV